MSEHQDETTPAAGAAAPAPRLVLEGVPPPGPRWRRVLRWALFGAVVEGQGGPWFFKAVGPKATIEQARPAFHTLLGSLDPHR